MNKRIVFAGDSWFWTWSANLRSDFLKKHRQISFFELFFKQHWLDIKILNKGGIELDGTIDIIDGYNNSNPQENDILVVFVSSPVRSSNTFLKHNIDTNNYDNFISQFLDLYSIQFKHLDEWSKKHKIPVVLLGGQSPIVGNTFDLYIPGKFLARDIVREYVDQEFNDLEDIGPFALHHDWYKDVSEDWNPKIIEKIHSDFDTFRTFTENKGKVLFYPDNGHFNLTGQQFTLDYLFRYLKRQNLLA